jgi:hypothetical protein
MPSDLIAEYGEEMKLDLAFKPLFITTENVVLLNGQNRPNEQRKSY